ncbi:MAG: NAD(P)H-dependent oxidoreductase [Oligoflexia bacterium]|nr:NAD(P)H-dependent oxidoreductase [Oligoflexia bacterium]
MKIMIIAGSHRENSESERVARYIEGLLKGDQIESDLFSLQDNPLPLWEEGAVKGDPDWKTLWQPVSARARAAEGFVIVSPEWSGMVPAGLKNFFLLCNANELAHKPALIVTVSSGLGGSYPVSELRTSSYKNTRICYLPDHVIVRNCNLMLKGDSPANDHDASLRKRLAYCAKLLVQYTKALALVRESGVIDLKNFPFGL